jgi:hypothetical protein
MTARPVFVKWSLAVFVILLPFLGYSIWDLVEATRLQSRVQSGIQPAHQFPRGQAAAADRYYNAAAALASYELTGTKEVWNRIGKAMREGVELTPEMMSAARRRLDLNRDALEFVDRAAALPFGESGYVRYTGRAGQLMLLSLLCELRAMVRAMDGDANGAVASLNSEARLGRAMRDARDSPLSFASGPAFNNLTTVLKLAKPSASSLEPLAAGLADLDHDGMKEELTRFRVAVLNDFSGWRPPSLMPEALGTHLTVRSIDKFTELIAASERPWPARIDALRAVGEWPVPVLPWGLLPQSNRRRLLEAYVHGSATYVRRVRCARLTVDGRVNLIDPFTGRRLEMLDCHL